jgi:hypothetical protein
MSLVEYTLAIMISLSLPPSLSLSQSHNCGSHWSTADIHHLYFSFFSAFCHFVFGQNQSLSITCCYTPLSLSTSFFFFLKHLAVEI